MSTVRKSAAEAAVCEAAEEAIKSGVCSEEFRSALLTLVPLENRKVVGHALDLDPDFTPFIRRTVRAIEELLSEQAATDEPIDSADSKIVQRAAIKFRVTSKAIERAFDGTQSALGQCLKTRGFALKRSV